MKVTAEVKNWLADLMAVLQEADENEAVIEIHLDTGVYFLSAKLDAFEPRKLNG